MCVCAHLFYEIKNSKFKAVTRELALCIDKLNADELTLDLKEKETA